MSLPGRMHAVTFIQLCRIGYRDNRKREAALPFSVLWVYLAVPVLLKVIFLIWRIAGVPCRGLLFGEASGDPAVGFRPVR